MTFCVKNKKGFTLVELMITMAVVGIIMAAVVAAFDVQQKSQVKQQLISEVQQNARAAMYLLAWDVRMAGYALGEGKISIPVDDGTDWYYIKAIELIPNGNTDMIEILYADSKAKSNLEADMPGPSAEWKVDDTAGFNDCDLVIISDVEHSAVMEITHVQDGHKLQHNPADCSGLNPVGGTTWKDNKPFSAGAQVHKLRYMTYAIQDAGSAHPWLGLDRNGALGGYSFVPFVDDIEDLQAVYIFEDEGEANNYNDTDMDDTNDFDDIRAVRITIVARTRVQNEGFKGGRKPAIEGNPAGPKDWYGRRVLSLELKIRNIDM
jgi:prepilin-type N-terminal cleavage/methylation domain-containing protein